MRTRLSGFAQFAFTFAMAPWLIAGCEDKNSAAAVPTVEQTRAITEEGFIYGLPIVMNYAVMNEYAVDKAGPQFKAPFNPDQKRSSRLYLRRYCDYHAQ
jgi:hypothetical protein